VTRGRWIALSLVVTVLVTLGLVAPRLFRRRVEATLALRSGCSVTVDRIQPGVRAVALEGTRLECAFGEVELRRVEVDLSWLEVADGGRPSAVRVVGGQVRLRSRPVAPASGSSGGTTDGVAHETPMRLEVESVDVEVLSGAGVLLRGRVSGHGDRRSFALHVTELEASTSHHPSVAVEDLAVVADQEGGWGLREVRARGVRVVAGDGPPALDAARAWLRGPGAPDGAAEPAMRSAPWTLLREGGTIAVEDVSVRDADGIALAGMGAEVVRVSGSRFRTRGRGEPRGEGVIEWDVGVDAEQGSVEGPVRLTNVPLSVMVPFLSPLPLHDPARTLISADVRVSTGDGAEVAVDGWARADGLAIESPRIASAPVLGIAVRIDGAARWRRSEHEVVLERATVRLGAATAALSGRALMDGDRYAFDLRATVPPTPCDAAVHAIPAGLLQDLVQMRLDGRLAASVELHVDSENLDATILRFAVDDGCRFSSVPPMAEIARFQEPFHHEVLEPDGSVFAMETGPGTPTWTPITSMSPFLVHAVLAHEDASFFTHSGFAPWAIRDALVRNLRERRYVLGASTITMQLVKNIFLRREKTLARKIQEVLLTWWLESSMTKAEILELYLNVIEYGPRVYGIRNAATHYFGRDPAELSVAQASYLAMILPNPPRFHEHYEAGEVPAAFLRRADRFVNLMRERGRIDLEAAEQGRAELAAFAFSRDGAPVGPPILQGGSAQLPIEGFSGFPAMSLVEGEDTSAVIDEESDPEAGGMMEEESSSWEGEWP